MNLQQLEYFRKVAETENFTAAAALVSVTQPALSKAISKLEAELNVSLFERNGRNVKLTSFGEAFLKHANIALLEVEKGIRELQAMANPDKGIISIASTYCIGTYFMPFIISGFLNSCPCTKFQFNHESTPEILNDLKDGKIDLGFYDNIDDIHKHTEIKSIPVKKEEYVLIVPKSHPLSNQTEVSLKDLKDESFIVFSEGYKDMMLSYSELMGYTPKISIQPNEVSMLGGLVAAGAGITIVPNAPLINTSTVSIIKIKENIGYRTIYMGWLKDSYISPVAKKFRDYVISLASNS
ncbi:LysR family transcriptional regulator [Clostridium polyendosporum]|uniref:LysR family transcriptional regulator n=1 Tax=Clostridium polyendosporum TaxID=69208 RepID=A0A919RY75_9CLOT|nr:LysR family transcriptional regulator [Clostridium polyendosporum]GIM28462.1 LysR family transcriptional regulator [Clostridium polyendosporum]